MIDLQSPVATVLGAKETKRKRLADGLGIHTVGDLLHHFPRRYVRTGELTKVAELEQGQMLTVVGEIVRCDIKSYQDRRTGRPANRVETLLSTDGPSLRMTFFAKNKFSAEWRARTLAVGTRGLFVGQVSSFQSSWQLTNPKMVLFGAGDDGDGDGEAAWVKDVGDYYPIYPLTKGVESWDVQRAVAFALTVLDDLPELLPDAVRAEYDVLDVRSAFDGIHAPDDPDQVDRAQHRFRFEEALVTQLVLARRRMALRALGARARTGGGGLLAAFDARLPFELTGGQREIGAQIEQDLAESHPMNRLLQGEVGSGKTLVALRAMLRVVDSGGQAALLAPTEVLAQQHHRSIVAMLGDLAAGGMLGGADEGTAVELLTGSMTKAQRTGTMSRMASGEAGLVIGTHALLEDRVGFAELGLVVVDEQHRFGVEQRAALTGKAATPPHVLVMTATPIPRTVAMTIFGDLETSTLTELPAGRAPIQTNVVPLWDHPEWISRVWERVREEVSAGHQVYVVCPRITGDEPEEGETDQLDLDEDGNPVTRAESVPLSAVEDIHDELVSGPLAGLRLAMLHGRLHPDEKDRTMRAFSRGEIDVLVSTTVIEVGVDVANATGMVLLDADRFGVSQLHQLRGRVGRGGHPGLCLLVTHSVSDTPARERLDAVARTTDGFELSRVDLAQRREGDVLGKSQSGFRSGLQTSRCCATRTRSSPRGPARRTSWPVIRTCWRARSWPLRWQRWSNHGSLTSWRSRESPRHGPPWSLSRQGAGAQMTRIIGGSAGGRRLTTPRGVHTRPTSDRVREALFSAVESWCGSLHGLRFLDLYAGSGAVGLEAWSRGAGVVTLVEQDRRTAALISGNARTLGFPRANVVAAPVAGTLRRPPAAPYDVAFLDPPYPLDDAAVHDDLAALVAHDWLVPGAMVVVERSVRSPEPAWPGDFTDIRERRYGESVLWYGHAASTPLPSPPPSPLPPTEE